MADFSEVRANGGSERAQFIMEGAGKSMDAMDETDLKNFLIERVNLHWASAQNMLLLADVPSELRENNQPDYQSILKTKRLKSFALETEERGGYRLVQHPYQKAKLGLVPYEAEFEFHGDSEAETTKYKKRLPDNTRATTLEFLKIVSILPDKDQSDVNISTRIIAKLLNN